MFYGLAVRDPPGPDDPVTVWVAVTDPDDCLVPADRFLPCDSFAEGVEELRRRYPCPTAAEGGIKFGRVVPNDHSTRVKVASLPVVTEMSRYGVGGATFPVLVAAATAHGGVWVRSADAAFANSWRDINDRAGAVRKLPGYATDDFVVTESAAAPGWELLVRRPDAAKRRQKAAATKRAAADKAALVRQEQNRLAEIQRGLADRRQKVTEKFSAAYRALWAACPALVAVNKDPPSRYTYRFNDNLTGVRAMAAVYDRFHGRGAWRKVPKVGTAFAAYAAKKAELFDPWYATPAASAYGADHRPTADDLAWLAANLRPVARAAGNEKEAAVGT